MLHYKTKVTLLAAAITLFFANMLSLRIPFDEGDHAVGGYMIKTGWPCAFYEQTARRTIWETRDLAIDAAVALSLLLAITCGSELTIRRRWNYPRFMLLVAISALLAGLNLHERLDDSVIVRGFPFVALVNGPFALHHNRIEPLGLIGNLLVAVMIGGIATRLMFPNVLCTELSDH